MTQVFRTIAEFCAWRKTVRGSLAFVPTMGALHDAHLALLHKARERADNLVASIFVNPLQFGLNEDFSTYPRPFEQDLKMCKKTGAAAVFYPSTQELYPSGKDNCFKIVPPTQIADVLEGAFRPGFFTGVATVVAKLFNIVQPDYAFFGEKDFQQLLVVKQMVKDLNLPCAIESIATVRADDGLALSSRNLYLSAADRAKAPLLYQTLQKVRKSIEGDKASVAESLEMGAKIFENMPEFALQYLDARDSQTFAPHTEACNHLVILIAAKLNHVRLIDNLILT